MERISRDLTPQITRVLERGKSVLLLGPRQVGKTTLLGQLPLDLMISLARPAIRQQYEKNIERFSQEVEALHDQIKRKPLVAIDEVQKVPDLMDATQDLIDRDVAQFILTGSSARKLKHHQVNWLPGRVIYFHLGPLSLSEIPSQKLILDELLMYGTLPEILLENEDASKEQDLESYVVTYLEEEIRQEALVRKLGDFAKFLQLAAVESGQLVNYNNIASDVGIAQTTITSYYQILEDCLIAERIEPFSKTGSIRRRLVKSPKYLFFDLGVRRLAAREGSRLNYKQMGQLFEQFIGLMILDGARNRQKRITLNFWRDLEGREVDWVISDEDRIIPIEVKWTDHPTVKDIRYLKAFMKEYALDEGYIVCRCDRARKIDEQIIALPWQELESVM